MTQHRLPAAIALCLAVRTATAAFEPTPLALEVNAGTAPLASKQLSQQLGFPVDCSFPRGGGINYSGESQPFAVAFKTFLENANLTCQERGSRMGLAQGQPLRTIVIGDSVAVVIARANLYASSSRGGAAAVTYSLDTYVVYDPALQFAGTGQRVAIDSIETDGGRATPAENNGFDPFGLYQSLAAWPGAQATRITFSTPTPVKRLTKLSARVRAWQVAEAAAVELPLEEFANGKSSEGNSLTVTANVTAVAGNMSPPTVSITLTGPAADRYRSGQWTQALQKCVRLLDKDGRSLIDPNSYANLSTANKSVTITFRSNGSNNGNVFEDLATIKVSLPTKVRSVDVPIEITDLDLPGTD